MSEKNIIQSSENNITLKSVWMPFLLSLTMVAGILVGMKLKNEPLINVVPKTSDSQNTAKEIIGQGRMEEILRYVDAKYVDPLSDKTLVEKAINNLLQELDPHSIYIPAENLKDVAEELEGEYEGIGIETIFIDDTINIITPLSNSPASTAGILPGDKIMSIGDSTAIGRDKKWLNNKLRGKKGTTIKLGILRENETKTKIFTIPRDKVPLHSVDVATVLDDKTGYIKLSRFNANTTKEFISGLEKLVEKKGVKDIIIDLRQNPGGYLDKAVDVLSQIFKEKDKLLVYTKGRTVHRNEYKSNGRNRYEIGKVAILIDEGSASASEIVAGAVQDWDRGIIVGRRSFGKGLVQEPYTLKDGSELRLTVARYFTPTGRSIQKPYKNKTRKIFLGEVEDDIESSEVQDDSADAVDAGDFYTASGRLVHGGGGIQPDITIPLDPVYNNDYYIQLKPWIHEYAYRYYSSFRKDIKYNDWQEYQNKFRITDFAFNDFIKYTQRQGVPIRSKEVPSIKEYLRKQLKARIARLVYGEEGYYGILNDNDPIITKALDFLKQKDPLGLNKPIKMQ